VRAAVVAAFCVVATAAPARADDLCARPHHGAAIDLDVKAADVHDVFRLLADVGHVNLVVGDNVTGKVTVKLTRVAWDAAACAVADLQHLAIDVDGNILLVTPRQRQ
jgi:type IV pilus assembly protein PilQ